MTDSRTNVKPAFGAIPYRAFEDPHLKGVHFRVFGVIAYHDRFGKNGIGCMLSLNRIAEMASCHAKTAAKAVRELATWGYIEAEPMKADARRNMLRVVYDEQAAEEAAGTAETEDRESADSLSQEKGSRVDSRSSPHTPINISREATGKKSCETTPPIDGDGCVESTKQFAAMLSKIERQRRQQRFGPPEARAWFDWLMEKQDDFEDVPGLKGWAMRMQNDLCDDFCDADGCPVA